MEITTGLSCLVKMECLYSWWNIFVQNLNCSRMASYWPDGGSQCLNGVSRCGDTVKVKCLTPIMGCLFYTKTQFKMLSLSHGTCSKHLYIWYTKWESLTLKNADFYTKASMKSNILTHGQMLYMLCHLTLRKQLSVFPSVRMSVTFSNRLLTPNHLCYRNGTDLFRTVLTSQFQWCPLCWFQTPKKHWKSAKNFNKHKFLCLSIIHP